MRLSTWKRTFVSGVAVAGITFSALACASATAAAAPTATTPAVSTKIAPQATQNLGLSIRQAKGVQRHLKEFGYNPGTVDGYLGTDSWKAMQRALRDEGYGYTSAIDGIVGTNTIQALQRALKKNWDYAGPIDGIAGDGTRAAFARMGNAYANQYGY
ncbi:peptidoglycan-binding domain-containing protein [Streptomyces sp. NPDC000070]|uniref:peptidoglycan-binding domain-containing protein n=1 Tax=Streptomyces sp. NPDC000070 TaxID=3154240 RepID=UPI0033289C57